MKILGYKRLISADLIDSTPTNTINNEQEQ